MNSTQWLVLDNVKQGWAYWTNVNRDKADDAYRWLIESGLIKDGRITPEGVVSLMLPIQRTIYGGTDIRTSVTE